MTPEFRLQIVESMSKLGDREFIELMYECLKSKQEDKTLPDDDFWYQRWCLALTSFGSFQGKIDSAAEVLVISPGQAKVPEGGSDFLCQEGRCSKCRVNVISITKVAACPACSSEVYCT